MSSPASCRFDRFEALALARKLSLLILASVLFIFTASDVCWCQADRSRFLSQFTSAKPDQLLARINSAQLNSPNALKALAVDLVIYRWAARASGFEPDIKNLDAIITAIDKASGDTVIKWCLRIFPNNGKSAIITLPPAGDDKRIPLLTSLQKNYAQALGDQKAIPKEAIESLKSVLELCPALNLELSEAQALSELGDHYLFDTAEYQSAENCYSPAIVRFLSYDCTVSSARLYGNYGLLKLKLGSYKAANDSYQESARQWLLLADLNPSVPLYRNLAGQQFLEAGRALILSGESTKGLELMRIFGLRELGLSAQTSKKYANLINNLIMVSNIYKDRGSVARSIDLLKWAERACNSCGDPLLKASTYRELADAYKTDGDDDLSRKAYATADRILKSTAATGDSAILKLTRSHPFNETTRLSLISKASKGASAYVELKMISKAADIWNALAPIYSKLGMVENRIQTLASLASYYDDEQNSAKALSFRMDAALSAWKAHKVNLAVPIVRDMIEAFKNAGDLQNAIEGLRELAPFVEATGDVRGKAGILEARGDLLAKIGQNDSAVKDLKDAVTIYRNLIGDSWAASEAAIHLARSQVAIKHFDDAQDTLDTALKYIEPKYASESMDPEADPAHAQAVVTIYHDLVSLHISQNKRDLAENIVKRASKLMLYSKLIEQLKLDADPKIATFAGEADVIGIGENGLSQNLGREELLADNWNSFYDACSALREQYAAAYNALPVNPLELFAQRRKIPDDCAIVIYLSTNSPVYAMVCTKEKAVCRKLRTPRSTLEGFVDSLHKSLRSCESNMAAGIMIPPIMNWELSSFADIKAHLEDLYGSLISPISTDISSKTLVTFACSDLLAGIPMHSLLVPQSYYRPRFFVEDHAVAYLTGMMLDNFLNQSDFSINSLEDKLTILADPADNLPGARAEAQAIKSVYSASKCLYGTNATVDALINEAQTANLIHIAAHFRPGSNSSLPALASVRSSDGHIEISDLAKLNNDKLKLVVLSACNTISSTSPISSEQSHAAEILTLAGARSVIGGMWNVSDDATVSLMEEFYRGVSGGKTKAEALRSAQIKMIQSSRFSHPFYWASISLFGNPW